MWVSGPYAHCCACTFQCPFVPLTLRRRLLWNESLYEGQDHLLFDTMCWYRVSFLPVCNTVPLMPPALTLAVPLALYCQTQHFDHFVQI